MTQDNGWDNYWKEFIQEKKLDNFIKEMNQVDEQLKNQFRIEEICHKIYEDYQTSWKEHLEDVRTDFLKMLDRFKHIHLQTSRIKTVDSLLEKVITKRYNSLRNSESLYARIDGENYKDIVTDLMGIRIILNYRGNWKDIHKEVLDLFSYDRTLLRDEEAILPRSEYRDKVLVQIPKAYYAQGDKIEEYQRNGLIAKLHPMGYRSIHYTISYQGVYVELQVRTIYDEAWSDCDHNYVYKQDKNRSHSALVQLSRILCRLTNISNDMGENMKEIFEKQLYIDIGRDRWAADEDSMKRIDDEIKRLYEIIQDLETFKSHIQIEQEAEKFGNKFPYHRIRKQDSMVKNFD